MLEGSAAEVEPVNKNQLRPYDLDTIRMLGCSASDDLCVFQRKGHTRTQNNMFDALQQR